MINYSSHVMSEKLEQQGWESVQWHPPRMVDDEVDDVACVLHFMYRMPKVPDHRTRSFVDADKESVYLDGVMLEHRDRLMKENRFDIGKYVQVGLIFMYEWKKPEEMFKAGLDLYEMFTPIYTGLHDLGCSNQQLFG
jgi:hypothetical protein